VSNKKLSIFYYFHLIVFLLFLTFAIIFLSVSVYNAKQKFQNDSRNVQENYINTQKALLEKEVNGFIEHINNRREEAYANTQSNIRDRVYEAYDLATKLYEKNKGKLSDSQIQSRIIEALRLLHYENRGYYFITRLDGVAMLCSDQPDLEGQNMLHFLNYEGRCVVQGMLDIAHSTKEGYYEYAWSKPSHEDNDHKKIAYVKLFEPYGWLIGTGAYIDDLQRKIQKDIIDNEKRLWFDKAHDGYLFMGTWGGFSLSYPAKNRDMYDIKDINGKYVVRELIKKAQHGGGFVEYAMPNLKNKKALTKLSYVRSYNDWKWYIGAGIYIEDMNQNIKMLEDKMYVDLQRTFYSIGIWILLFSGCVGLVYFFINRRMRKDFQVFIAFFDSLANKDQFIDTQSLKFKEFEELALHANAMLASKIKSNQHLEEYKKIVSSSEDFLALIDRNYTYLAVSEAYQRFFNKDKKDILGNTMPKLFGEQYFIENIKHLSDRVLRGEIFESEYWVLSSYGKRFVHSKFFPYYEKEGDTLPVAYVVSARDNTEKKANEDRLIASEKALEFLAHNDALTGLPNRLLLSDRITHGIENSKRHGGMIAVCFIDFDNFKKINDSYGHSYGDEILKQFSLRVQKIIRPCDTLSRIGGDEFVLLIETIKEMYEIEVILQKIQSIFEEPFINKHQKFFLTASIGISVYPDHGTDGETLIKNADAAMYKAKDAGKNTYAFYTLDMTIASYERIGMENALREAIQEQQFLVYYQPQIDLKTKALIGLEALVRWNHPLEGILPPGRFIAFAEETRLIIEIGAFVLKQTCLDLVFLQKEKLFEGTVSINISGVQIEFSDFLTTLKSVIEETKIDPSVIEMEVTESFIMHDPERWISLLKKMQMLGISIAIDDFGTGYSSLSYLRKLPINKLKVDMSFVKDIPNLDDACAIVNSIITLAQNMKMITLAEGIEREEQERYLAD